MIQLGSILAVVWVYRVKLLNMMTGLATRPEARHFAAAIVVATIPALVAGALFAGYVKRILYQSPRVWAVAFIVGGIVMLLLERRSAPAGRSNARRTRRCRVRSRSASARASR